MAVFMMVGMFYTHDSVEDGDNSAVSGDQEGVYDGGGGGSVSGHHDDAYDGGDTCSGHDCIPAGRGVSSDHERVHDAGNSCK